MMLLSSIIILLISSVHARVPRKSPLSPHIQPVQTHVRQNSEEKVIITAKNTIAIDTSHIKLNAFELCLCGAFATAFGDFIMHPLDTIKVMQQAGGGLGLIETAKFIINKSGPMGLYQGVVPYITADGLRFVFVVLLHIVVFVYIYIHISIID